MVLAFDAVFVGVVVVPASTVRLVGLGVLCGWFCARSPPTQMFLAALAHAYVFSYEEFKVEYLPSTRTRRCDIHDLTQPPPYNHDTRAHTLTTRARAHAHATLRRTCERICFYSRQIGLEPPNNFAAGCESFFPVSAS